MGKISKKRIKQIAKDPLKAIQDLGFSYDELQEFIGVSATDEAQYIDYQMRLKEEEVKRMQDAMERAFWGFNRPTFTSVVESVAIDGEEIFRWEK